MLAINQVCAERQLAKEVVLEAVETALVTAYKRNFGTAVNITAKIDPETGTARVFTEKAIVSDVKDPKAQISLEEARTINPAAQVGETVLVETTPKDFGRIAAQTAKQVILQRIREAERDQLYAAYAEREGEIVTGTIQSIDSQVVIVNLGKAEGTLPRSEQIPGERYRLNQRLRAYVMEVEKNPRGPRIVLSRNHRNMLRRLLELEVPEIYNGAVEIKAIAREPGSRSKVAVAALRPGVDPVGSCVGMRGTRIQGIVSELNGEKIDVVEWSPDVVRFISNALSPAPVMSVRLDDSPDGKTATVIVPDKQLSLAIGKEGQNARLAAKLTGWRIDIKSATEAAAQVFAPEEAEKKAEAKPAVTSEEFLSKVEAMLLSTPAEAAPAAEPAVAAAEEPAVAAEPAPATMEEPVAPAPAPVAVPDLVAEILGIETAAPAEPAIAAEPAVTPAEPEEEISFESVDIDWDAEPEAELDEFAKPKKKGKVRRGRREDKDFELGLGIGGPPRRKPGRGRWD